MHKSKVLFKTAGVFIALIIIASTAKFAGAQKLTIHANQPTVALSPTLYGLFFEDINFGADGGLYAELVQNRSFEYFPVFGRLNNMGHELHPLTAWEPVYQDSGEGNIYVTRRFPLNANNTNNLEVQPRNGKGYIGVSNTGYNGIPLQKDESYALSFYVRWELNRGGRYTNQNIKALLYGDDGNVLDSATWNSSAFSGAWSKLNYNFKPNATAHNGRLTMLVQGQGRVQFDMISLMPELTYNWRKNGLRADLVQALKELNPGFLRFPGGCILHGDGLDNTYQWKHTVGDVAQRKPNWNRWGYHQTNGLGYYEYFLLCEDLNMQPLPVVPLGVSCSLCHFECVPMSGMDAVVQDALDVVEFANGSSDTKWGKIRAEMGHPQPFNLQYICLGNEEGDLPELRERVPLFTTAFRNRYPEIKLIGTSGLTPQVTLYNFMDSLNVWSSDEHYYQAPEWYITNQTRFDNWDRKKARVFVGEYASRGNTLYNALAEAIYLTGAERNADVVDMTCYAPLLARYGNTQWKAANLLYFNNQQVIKTPNYYVQQMFARNKGHFYLKNEQAGWPGREVATSVTFDTARQEIILKAVNALEAGKNLQVQLKGVRTTGDAEVTLLQGQKDDTNTLTNPRQVIPSVRRQKAGTGFTLYMPPYSMQVVRIKLSARLNTPSGSRG